MTAGSRREARERALSILYEADAKDIAVSEVLAAATVDPDRFAVELVEGVEKHREAFDAIIRERAVGWQLERMPVLDRCLLRIALYELLEGGTPTGAAISEAVELAKRYSTEDSARFINGVLAAVVKGREAPEGDEAD